MIKRYVDILELKEKYEDNEEETSLVKGYIAYKLRYGFF
jgi:hypothetical protein